MTAHSKTIVGIFAALVVVFISSAVLSLKGIDASKENPTKLFKFYVQKEIPPTVKIKSAIGHARPLTGTCITFRFEIDPRNLAALITSKHLDKTDALQPGLFRASDLAELKQPEFYTTDRDTTWAASCSSVRMAVDGERCLVLYMVFSP